MASGRFEPAETGLVRQLLADLDLFVNVGANIGYYCAHALSHGVSTVAIEPMPRNLNYLLTNLRTNGWGDNAEVFPVALGPSSGIVDIWGNGTGASLVEGWAGIPSSYRTVVPQLTLDTVLGKRLVGKRSLIIVDVEGSELGLLQGAIDTLVNQPRPTWIVEISLFEHQPIGRVTNPDFLETFKFFYDRGYRATEIGGGARELNPDDVKSMANGESDSPLTHNFLFCADQ
jgi:FkbM family methyltransferase